VDWRLTPVTEIVDYTGFYGSDLPLGGPAPADVAVELQEDVAVLPPGGDAVNVGEELAEVVTVFSQCRSLTRTIGLL